MPRASRHSVRWKKKSEAAFFRLCAHTSSNWNYFSFLLFCVYLFVSGFRALTTAPQQQQQSLHFNIVFNYSSDAVCKVQKERKIENSTAYGFDFLRNIRRAYMCMCVTQKTQLLMTHTIWINFIFRLKFDFFFIFGNSIKKCYCEFKKNSFCSSQATLLLAMLAREIISTIFFFQISHTASWTIDISRDFTLVSSLSFSL